MRKAASAYSFMLVCWATCTLISSVSGGLYLRATSDCLTPALLAQAAAAAFYSVRSAIQARKLEPNDHGYGHQAWVLALGVLGLISSILTLASFSISSVSYTYIVRSLEPIFSCIILYIVKGQERSATQLLLLAAVAVSTTSVVMISPQQDKATAFSSLLQTGAPLTQHQQQNVDSSGMHSSMQVSLQLLEHCGMQLSSTSLLGPAQALKPNY